MISKRTSLQEFDLSILDKLGVNKLRPVADSREARQGDVFLACKGEYTDGRDFIPAAIAAGVDFVLWDDADGFVWHKDWNISNLAVPQLQARAGIVAAYLLGQPSDSMHAVGVTGTNGKTSITQWLAQAFDLLNLPCAIIGTVGNGFFSHLKETTHTTPDAVHLQRLLAEFKKEGAQRVAIEVSSHGLDQSRVNGVSFETAVFTNLTRDHLDYHKEMSAYAAAKSRLFYWQGLQHAIVNIDDCFGSELAQKLHQETPELKVYRYGFSAEADIYIDSFIPDSEGTQISIKSPWGNAVIKTRLLGRFNAQNLAATLGVLCAQGHAFISVVSVLEKIGPAKGRMDCISEPGKPLVVVDYAHTPDALEKALQTLQEIKPEEAQLWCVFGCGGNRDKGKRPLMGKAVTEFADCAVVTSDNPRLEDPEAIIQDILVAVPSPALVEVNREKAIIETIKQAHPHDIVLIAGKGHELYQDAGGKKTYFSDFDVALRELKAKA